MQRSQMFIKANFLLLLGALLGFGIMINLLEFFLNTQQLHKAQNFGEMFLETKETKESKLEKIVISGIQSLEKGSLSEEQMDFLSRERVSMGRPNSKVRQIRIWSVGIKRGNRQCAIINGVNIITEKTIETAKNILAFSNIDTVLFVSDRTDIFAEQLIRLTFNEQYVQYWDDYVDADYEFVLEPLRKRECQALVYLAHNFEIGEESAISLGGTLAVLKTEVSNGLVWFLGGAGEVKDIKDLREFDLGSLAGWEFNQYLYVFGVDYFSIITPLNFAFYARFTIEQILLLPVLALSQQSDNLLVLPVDSHLHRVSSFPTVQYKQFQLLNVDETGSDLCFVSYPTVVNRNSIDTIDYLESLEKMQFGQKVGVIVGGVYYWNGQNSQKDENTHLVMKKVFEKLLHLKRNKTFARIRLLMKSDKTVSSLSAYQSAYTYCPLKSTIISSRHNVEFMQNFSTKLWGALSSKHHYYYIPFRYQNVEDVVSLERAPKWGRPYNFRENSTLYETHFKHLQIYRSQLLRTNYFWVLKTKELDFYESEASFVLPMLQMVKLDIGIIGKEALFYVHRRNKTEIEQQQQLNIRTYYEWTPLINNMLYPFPYNSLLNLAFRRNAPLKISAIIHQVWQGGTPSSFRMKLHSTLQQANPNFTMMLWRRQNITVQNFPMTLGLITRSLEYQKGFERSYFAPIASLIRYQAMYWHGGIYFDFKTQGMKQLTPFLKYEIFFTDAAVSKHRFFSPNNVGNPMMGATQHNYYLKIVLLELITQSKIDYRITNFPTLVGAYILRKSINDYEFFTGIGLGFHLFSPRPDTDQVNLCGTVNKFDSNQEIFEVIDPKTEKVYQIGIPCKMYPEAYALMYKPLGRTWLGKK